MRITTGLIANQAYYLRNPVQIYSKYEAENVAPHALTTRNQITPPYGYIWVIEFISIQMRRSVAPTVLGDAVVIIEYYETLLSNYKLVKLIHRDIAVHSVKELYLPCNLYLFYNNLMLVKTMDTSTGGAIDYNVTMKIVGFLA